MLGAYTVGDLQSAFCVAIGRQHLRRLAERRALSPEEIEAEEARRLCSRADRMTRKRMLSQWDYE